MKYFLQLFFALFTITIAHADVPPAQQSEVEHLLGFVRTSSCLISRNGTTHHGQEAAAHIQKKYDYFRDRITTTEQFIEYSATKSTMSGGYYTVLCNGQAPVRTKDWLLEELEIYRGLQERHGL